MNQLYWDNVNHIPWIVKTLQKGKVVLSATDTVLGLLANVSRDSFEQLNRIKKRADKPYLILLEGYVNLTQYIHIESLQIENFVKKCWPGPVTLIFEAKNEVPAYMKSQRGTIAFRVPDHAGLQKILPHFDGLFSTSANVTGNPIPRSIDEVEKEIVQQVDVIIVDKEDHKKIETPSTILDCTEKKIQVLREGAYPIDQLEELYGEDFIR